MAMSVPISAAERARLYMRISSSEPAKYSPRTLLPPKRSAPVDVANARARAAVSATVSQWLTPSNVSPAP